MCHVCFFNEDALERSRFPCAKIASNTRLWQTGEDKRTWSLKALKRQDLSPAQGMATVPKELGTHLDTGKLNIFRAARWHNA